MKHLLTASFLLIPILAGACNMDQIKVEHAYVRATPDGQSTTAGYLHITNDCTQPMQLTSVNSPVATRVELHDTTLEDGVSKMHKIDNLALSPKSTVIFAPGTQHLMFMGLKDRLTPGISIPMTFTFGDGSSKTMAVMVKDDRMLEEHQH